MNSIDKAYLRLLQAVRDNPKPFNKHDKLVAHYPMRGLADEVEIMFIGRALNDWTWQFDVPTPDADLDHLLKRIKSNVAEEPKPDHVYPEREQLRWVNRCDTEDEYYNTNRSQFWQTIRGVTKKRGADDKNWWHGIVWTNFLKMSRPKANPTAGMVSVIGKPSLELLLAEIAEYRPKYIVCLSGLQYAANLLARCTTTQRLPGVEDTRYIEYAGDVTVAGKVGIRLIVAPHPQGRMIDSLVGEILTFLD